MALEKIIRIVAAGILLLSCLAGCGEKSTTPPPPPVPQTGNIFISVAPDSLDGPWHLSGPVDPVLSGRGDSTLIGVESGEYVLSWDSVPDWNTPFAERRELVPGGGISFAGDYSLENPFQGLEFGTDTTLEVVTWNLEHFPKNDLVTVDLVARAIMTMDADILALQEIEDADYFRGLDDRLANWTGVRATSSAYDVNLAFLYRNSSDWVLDSVHEILTGLPREFPRAPYVLEGRFKGAAVVVINNHFKCCGDNVISEDPWDEETRRRDAGLLLDEYARNNYPDRKVIIVGDLNDSLTDDPARNVFNIFIEAPDMWLFADMDIAEGSSAGWSYPAWPSHLDHILINAPLFPAWEDSSAAISVIPLDSGLSGGWDGYDSDISDHLPVALKLVP